MQTQPDNFEKSGGSQYQAAGTFVPPPTVCEGAAGVIRGGQGRSAHSVTDSAELWGWVVLAAVILALACLTGCCERLQAFLK